MRRYPAVTELRKRDLCWMAMFFAAVPLVALSVMIYQSKPSDVPAGAWTSVGLLAATELALAVVIRFPRRYLTVDLERGTATFVDKGKREEMPIRDLEPLYVRKVAKEIRGGQGRPDRTSTWFRVETAAAPVVFYRAASKKPAAKALARLNRKFGFTRAAAEKTDYERAVRET
jgi:hypothetical protein